MQLNEFFDRKERAETWEWINQALEALRPSLSDAIRISRKIIRGTTLKEEDISDLRVFMRRLMVAHTCMWVRETRKSDDVDEIESS